jgi:hypothetical protein
MSRLSAARDRVESYPEKARQRYPMAAALAGLSSYGLERLGEQVRASRRTRIVLSAMVALLTFSVQPTFAQSVNCGKGPLGLLNEVQLWVVAALGIGFLIFLAGGALLKMVGVFGSSRIANKMLGGVFVAVVVVVAGVTFIDMAGSYSGGVDLNPQCGGGGGGGG